ncbi:MAG TPA: site-specific integrase [Xanthobacteraceae bacterium]|nr:site-specific integrase [Xanthobacteraceae bacterium]
MRALMGLIKDRHGTYYARHKVPKPLQEAVARLLGNGKAKQVWLKRSLGTKALAEANVRGKPVQIEFDRIIAEARAQLQTSPLRTSISDVEIKRIADFFYAHELAGDEELRMDGRGDDPMYASIHKQLTEAGVDFHAQYDLKSLTLEPGRGLSRRMMEGIQEDAANMLAVAEDDLARGDTRRIRYEVDELLKVFQINLDPSCEGYLKLARAVQGAFVKQLRAVQARHRGEPVETPPLIGPDPNGRPATGTLQDALVGWQKERSPSSGVLVEYQRAVRLFSELHGDVPIAQIKRSHARTFREALQDLPRHRAAALLKAPLPELAEWGRKHPEAAKISAANVNKLLGGVQTIARWSYQNGMIPDEVPWSDPFANMRLQEPGSDRDAFTIDELNTLFATSVFTKEERPKPGRGEAAFWLPLISLYTGTRMSEIAMLTVNDVQRVEGVTCFLFIEDGITGKRLKTRSSARTVPVHQQLIKLGWLRYVDGMRHKGNDSAWLFPEIAPSKPGAQKAWSKWFNRGLRSIGVTDRRKVFHSFRHTFKDALRAARVPEDLNDAITGHANKSVGRGYGAKEIVRRFGMKTLRSAIDAVEYRGLRLLRVKSGKQRKR